MPSLDRKLRFRLFLLHQGRSHYRDYYRLVKRMSDADPASMSERFLTDLVTSVYDSNDHYRALFSRFFPDDWRRLPAAKLLESLPSLTKDGIRDHFASLHSVGEFPQPFKNTSGGSTGRPVVLTQDANYASWSNATQGYYFREFLGVDMNQVKNVWLWGSERDVTYRSWGPIRRRHAGVFLRNQILLNTFDTNERQWLDYIDLIGRYRPYYVAGYAGSLYQLAKVARRHNVRLFTPRFVYSAAETLRDFMRDEIEDQFNAKVFDFYGSREVGAIAGECRSGRMHVFIMNNIVEILTDREGHRAKPIPGDAVEQTGYTGCSSIPASTSQQGGEGLQEGRLLVTNLHNLAFPMIRYDIGDTGSLGDGTCPCGSRLPTLAKLSGRVTDHFVRREGGLVHGEYFTHLFYFRPWIEWFQVDQLAYDHVRVRVVTSDAVNELDVAQITSSIRLAMGQQCNVEWDYVDEIDKSPQGKHVYTRSYLHPA